MRRYLALLVLLGGVAMGAEKVLVVNKGVGGHNSRQGLSRFARDVEVLKPECLILYFGINDALNSKKLIPVVDFRKNMESMVDRARACGVGTIVISTPNPFIAEYLAQRHPTHPQKADLVAHVAQYGKAVREIAVEKKLILADLGALFAKHGGASKDASCLIRNQENSKSADGVHPTAAGYKLMAEYFAQLLSGKIKPGQTVVCFGDSITFGAHMPGAGSATGKTYPAFLSRLLNDATPER